MARFGKRPLLIVTTGAVLVLLAGLALHKTSTPTGSSPSQHASASHVALGPALSPHTSSRPNKPSSTTSSTAPSAAGWSWSQYIDQWAVGSVPTGTVDSKYHAQLLADFHAGHGTVVPWAIAGRASGLPPLPALLYLPAAYGNPAAHNLHYPVVELLDGYHAYPAKWPTDLKLQTILDTLISTGHSLPFVAVMPTTNVAAPRDTECVNIVHGPAVETYLTRDVRQAVITAARVHATGWGVMGTSTGAYCAMNLAMRHTDLFAAAVSLSGYDRPYQDGSTGPGRLFYGSMALRDENSPIWEARHWHSGPLSILAFATQGDEPSYEETRALVAAAHPPLEFTTILVTNGGHNAAQWVSEEPRAFTWFSHRLGPPS